MEIFDLEQARRREAERRLRLLGNCAEGDYDSDKLSKRSRETLVPLRHITAWSHAYHLRGFEGLLPLDWTSLDEQSQQMIISRFNQLASLADGVTLTPAQVSELAMQNKWSYITAERWLRRYRIGGLWALAPNYDPTKQRRKNNEQRTLPDLGALDENLLNEVRRRQLILKGLVDQVHVPESVIEQRAKRFHISPRTVRNYLKDYRTYGLVGLVPKQRSDRGHYHNISERMEHLIGGIRLSQADKPIHQVHKEACERARLLGEPEPSLWQVRAICKQLPASVTTFADGRMNKYRNKYRITYRQRFDGTVIIYQIDFTPVDVLVKDMRKSGYRKTSGETRPRLTLCMDASSRLVLAGIFTYDTPDSFIIASAIRDALEVTEKKSYGGIPDEIWVDKGKQMISKHVQLLAKEHQIALHPCIPHHREDVGNPQEKGIVERFFKTLNTRLWATLPGYTHSNTVERNPNTKAELTLSELADKFWEFIETYHNEAHSETGMTPLAFWNEHCFVTPADPRQLDMLLQVSVQRRFIKEGIKYAGRLYWHDDLTEFIPVGADVLIRAQPAYPPLDEIHVYYKNQWICTAFAVDSEAGRAVTGERVHAAQRRQKKYIKHTIEQKRAALKDAEREIEQQKKHIPSKAENDASSSQPGPESGVPRPRTPRAVKKSPRGVWDELAEFDE